MLKIDGVYPMSEGPWAWGKAACDPAHPCRRTRARADFYADDEAAAALALSELRAEAEACGAELVSDGERRTVRVVTTEDGKLRTVTQEVWAGELLLLVRDGQVGSRAAVLLRESSSLLKSEPIAATVEA